ncbi:T9SS type B sorting domain-containing protein [Tenacibaculum aestuarii]|uniref:T9SS type B sorting domain-containing protein n=1 Tax=Tenacibaculum aestuarii TaxID=362781 RepID=UPI0038B5635A
MTIFLMFLKNISAQITLNHNVGNTLVETDMFSCDEDNETWSRVFKLSDFGIKPNEQFAIKSGQVGLFKSSEGATLFFNVAIIGSGFQNGRSINGIGSRLIGETPIINGVPQVLDTTFDTPIIVPAGTERILVSVSKYQSIYDEKVEVLIAGTENDNDNSWYTGCFDTYFHTQTENLPTPVTNANFYINVTGEVFDVNSSGATTRLTHSTCDDIVKTNIYGCTTGGMSWSRDFILNNFGISNNEEFVINSGQVAIYYANWGTNIQFRIYKIDDNFPSSFSELNLIGSSQIVPISYFGASSSPRIFEVDFDTPIVIPYGVERILVEVLQGGGTVSFPGGTSSDDNTTSWFRSYSGGCPPSGQFIDVKDLGYPETKFYVNVTGNVNHVTNNFDMNISNICSEFLKEFSIQGTSNITSVTWNFGDPTSGTDNISSDLSPFHDFSSEGTYTITANVLAEDGTTEVLTETIEVKEPPTAYGINNIYACEDVFNTGVSSSFDTSSIKEQVLGGQSDKIVTFIDGSGKQYESLPNPFTNTIANRETIKVRVSHKDNLCCYSETSFDLIINPLPSLELISDLKECDTDSNGYATFNLQEIHKNIIGNSTNIKVEFYHENGRQILTSLSTVTNLVINQEIITVKAINTDTGCYNQSTIKLIVNPIPIANPLQEIFGCDDNNDGISEYFDTSNIESLVLGNQTGVEVSYYDNLGNKLPYPLPNPYTNTSQNNETITVRVTDILSQCYSETPLILKTITSPVINQPSNIYACNLENGITFFDLSNIKNEMIENQTGLKVTYFDMDGNELQNTALNSYKNTKTWSETINVRVENIINDLCYIETSFNLIVNELPIVNLEKEYFLCNLEPSLPLSINESFDSYEWFYQDNTLISKTHEVNLIYSGNYKLIVREIKNDILCENSFEFELIRSTLPQITGIKQNGTPNNGSIEIIATGDGDFEYSIDGENFQDSNYFSNLEGETYTAYVRDKKGCGTDSKNITMVNYPKFFTPNNDGYNDFWQIKGIENFPNSRIAIYDRYGKLLKTLTSKDPGWDGFYNNKKMPSNTYWFKAIMDEENIFSGYFALKR